MQHGAPKFAEKFRLRSGFSDVNGPELFPVRSAEAGSNKTSEKMKQMNEFMRILEVMDFAMQQYTTLSMKSCGGLCGSHAS